MNIWELFQKMTNLKDVKIGSWLGCNDGIFEVVSEYDSYHDWYLVREVILSSDYENNVLSDEVYKMTSREVKSSELMN